MFATPHTRRNVKLTRSHSSLLSLKSRDSRNSSMERTSPGPGQYEVDDSVKSTEKNQRISKIPTEKRFRGLFKPGISPGPIYMARDTGNESSHRTLPKISFPKDERWTKRADRRSSLSPSPSTYKLPAPKTRNVAPITQDLSKYD